MGGSVGFKWVGGRVVSGRGCLGGVMAALQVVAAKLRGVHGGQSLGGFDNLCQSFDN